MAPTPARRASPIARTALSATGAGFRTRRRNRRPQNLAPRNQRHAGVEHFLPQLPNSPSTAAARPIQTAITSPIPAALLHSKIDCLPLGWRIGRRRKSFPRYHGCTLIHKSTPYFAFSSSALLALGTSALLGLSTGRAH